MILQSFLITLAVLRGMDYNQQLNFHHPLLGGNLDKKVFPSNFYPAPIIQHLNLPRYIKNAEEITLIPVISFFVYG